jgi:hypothetical protein
MQTIILSGSERHTRIFNGKLIESLEDRINLLIEAGATDYNGQYVPIKIIDIKFQAVSLPDSENAWLYALIMYEIDYDGDNT